MKKVKQVALIAHAEKAEAVVLAKELVDWFSQQGVEIHMPEGDAHSLDCKEYACTFEKLFNLVDLVVALGGDGTFLRAVRLLKGKEIPLIGVNLGEFGFLSEIQVSELYSSLAKVIEGNFDIEKRMMLDCEIQADGKRSQYLALNEVVVSKGIESKLVRLAVDINGKFFNRYACDGIIFATPTGSTAYSLSAGGPVVNPRTSMILMTPVCSHTLFGRTLILDKGEEAKIECCGGKTELSISIDGMKICHLESFDFVRICASTARVDMVRIDDYDFFSILKKKLKKRALYQFEEE